MARQSPEGALVMRCRLIVGKSGFACPASPQQSRPICRQSDSHPACCILSRWLPLQQSFSLFLSACELDVLREKLSPSAR